MEIEKKTLTNNGKLTGAESLSIIALTLTGSGEIKSPKTTITVSDIREYTGTIECSGECIIRTKTPMSEFKMKLVGSFVLEEVAAN